MIPEVNPYNNYRGDGVATLFDYDFFIQNGSQLIVEHIDENDVVTRLEENIDYEIVVIEEEFAGYIKFPIEDSKFGILQENETLSLQLTLPFEQISEYGQSSLLDLNSIEFSLDYLTRLCQILKRQMERSVRVNEGSEATPEQLLETINNNAIVSTNAAALASQKADEAMESANVAINASEEIDIKINGFNESYEKLAEDLKQEGEKAKEEIETKSNQEQQEIINISKEAKEAIGDIKVIATLEIGDIGFTQMAIDESKGKRRYLNGQIIIQDQYQQLTNILKASIAQNPDMACTEQEWQAEVTMSTAGICYKFVVDDEGGTIRLPKYPNYFIGGVNDIAPVVGNGLSLGLTNGSGNYGIQVRGTTNVIMGVIGTSAESYGEQVGVVTGTTVPTMRSTLGVTTDSTKSGIEAQIKQEQIKGTYFIQVATGAETEDNIVNTLELNNPFVLLEPKFFESEVYNVSWLLANGTYNGSNTIHPSAYQALLIENNTEVAIGSTVTLPIGTEYTKRGLSVKLSTDSDITDYDFVVNTSDETFRCPLKVNLASGKAVVGNGMTLGLTDGTGLSGLRENEGILRSAQNYGNAIGTNSGTGDPLVNNITVGITQDPTKSGIELSDSDLYLYFYVGETVQNANLVNVGRIEEIVVNKLDRSNKQEIMSWGIPDYSRGIIPSHPTSSAPFTAPADGIFVDCFYYSSENTSTLYVNGVQTKIAMRTGASNRDNRSSVTVPLSKGDVIYWSTGSTTTFAIGFYPFKGSN